jgi:hypothetical protein
VAGFSFVAYMYARLPVLWLCIAIVFIFSAAMLTLSAFQERKTSHVTKSMQPPSEIDPAFLVKKVGQRRKSIPYTAAILGAWVYSWLPILAQQ